MNCPICNSKLEEINYTEEIWGSFETVEIHHNCKNCNLYEFEYVYGNSCRWIYKKVFSDEKQHKLYIKFIRILYKLGAIGKKMKFKEFSEWCNNRACDGCWGMKEAIMCSNICKEIYKLPFWKREKAWKDLYENFITTNVVIPINNKIKESKECGGTQK